MERRSVTGGNLNVVLGITCLLYGLIIVVYVVYTLSKKPQTTTTTTPSSSSSSSNSSNSSSSSNSSNTSSTASNTCLSSDNNGTGTCSQVLKSANCEAKLQSDGNFVVYDAKGNVAWSSATFGKGTGPYSMKMQPDGNFVLYDSKSAAIWSSGTASAGTGPFTALLKDNCTFEIFDSKHKSLWASKVTTMGTTDADPNVCSSSGPGSTGWAACATELKSGDCVATMQTDGNFVIYDKDKKPVWQTYTQWKGKKPYKTVMQSDGNFVIYDKNSTAIWHSDTRGANAPFSAILKKDCTLDIIDNIQNSLWSTKK